jgi:hypothetical protein
MSNRYHLDGREGTLQELFPRTSFPQNPTDTMGALPIVGWPAYDKTTQRIESAVGHEVDGEWVTWQIVDLTTDELNARLQSEITQRTQQRLDQVAQAHGYDSIISACTYNLSAIARYAAEGQYCIALRDSTWSALEQILTDVEAGTRAVPTGFDEIEPELPAVEWPI